MSWPGVSKFGVFTIIFVIVMTSGCSPKSGDTSSGGSRHASARLEQRELGSAAPLLLKDAPYSKLVLEIASVPGREPTDESLDFLVSFLSNHLHKPGGISVVSGNSLGVTGTDGMGAEELALLEDGNRKTRASGDTLSVYLMFVDNHHNADAPDGRILGLAYRATSLALFEDTINIQALGGDRELVEKNVLAHELGHILGLVNFGTPMVNGDHRDPGHTAGHCKNPLCLMNYQVHARRMQLGPSDGVPELDEDCLADLRAAGGK